MGNFVFELFFNSSTYVYIVSSTKWKVGGEQFDRLLIIHGFQLAYMYNSMNSRGLVESNSG